ncbi:MAG: hypothetical protein ABIQ47_04225 [Tepidiformaceae bacterium]
MPLTPAPALYVRLCSSLLHGWRFWSQEGELKPKRDTETKPGTRKSAKPESKVKQIRRIPNQKGVNNVLQQDHLAKDEASAAGR